MNRLVLFLCALLLPLASFGQAQSVTGLDQVSNIVKNAPGVGTVGTVSGVTATAANDAIVKPSGTRIPVSAAANIGKSRIATAAIGCTNPIGAVLCAATAAQVLSELNKAGVGYHKCPDGSYAFLCQPNPDTLPENGYIWHLASYPLYYRATNGQGVCNTIAQDKGFPGQYTFQATSTTGGRCNTASGSWTGYNVERSNNCANGFTMQNGACTYTGVPLPPKEMTDAEALAAIQKQMDADYQANKRLYDALRADQAAAEQAGKLWPEPLNALKPDTPITVTAPPVTSPKTTTKTETIPNPDGSTSTRTTEEQTTYTPQQRGTTVGDTQIVIPSQTTITTTTVNNTTNQTSVQTSVVNNPPMQSEAPDIPTDYARENTLKRVADALSTEGAPELADQEKRVTDAKTDGNTSLTDAYDGVKNSVQGDKDSFFSWVWTPQIFTCTTPAPVSVRGVEVGFGGGGLWCEWAEKIREAIGWLFGLVSAMTVYYQMFRKGE